MHSPPNAPPNAPSYNSGTAVFDFPGVEQQRGLQLSGPGDIVQSSND